MMGSVLRMVVDENPRNQELPFYNFCRLPFIGSHFDILFFCRVKAKMPYFQQTKHPTYRVVIQQPVNSGQEIIGWWVFDRRNDECCGCIVAPDPSNLSVLGWVTSFLLLLTFWPATCLPCFCSCCYDGYQVPVFAPRRPAPTTIPSAPSYDVLPVAVHVPNT